MTDSLQQLRYVANPVIVATLTDGVLIKRGSVELSITGPAIAEIISTLLDCFSGQSRTKTELLECFPAAMHESVETLFSALVTHRLVQPEDEAGTADQIESPTELFFWDHGVTHASLAGILSSRRFVVLGVNAVSRAVVTALRDGGFEHIVTIDVPNLRNVRFINADGEISMEAWPAILGETTSLESFIEDEDEFDCLVGTSDLGGMHLLRDWNRFAVDSGVAFFPVVLQNMRGYFGPLVIPGETACYECYRARQNSHISDPESQRASEVIAHETQLGVSSLPAMTTALGSLAGLELTKFFVSRIAGWHVGTAYELNMLDLSLKRQRVLRIPRCSVCDRRTKQSAVSLDEKLFIPHKMVAE